MDKRIFTVRQQENILNMYEENKDRIDPLVNIKVLEVHQFAHRKVASAQHAEQLKIEENLRNIHNISKPVGMM